MITTSRQIQLLIIKYYSLVLQSKNIQIISSSRGGLHLRINYSGDVKEMLNSIHPCDLIVSEISMSGSFITNELILKENLPGGVAKKGDAIYFVNAVSSKGVLKSKQLTPNKLSITGVKIKKTEFFNKVVSAIEKLNIPDNIKFLLNEISEQSMKPNPKLSDRYIGAVSDTDINIIAKDFGEISGALWFSNVHNKNVDSIEYPSAESSRLIDYYVYEGKKKISISAKANEGAPPSIDAIAEILKTMSYSIDMKEMARKAIIDISDNSTVDGIVLASNTLDTPGYKWIKKNLFNNKDFTANDCEIIMKSFQSPEEVFKRLDSLYKTMKRSPSFEKVKYVFDTKRKRLGILISPLGYHLIDQLNNNNDNDYLEVLNDAAKTIVATQLYIKINKNTKLISYEVKEFSSSDFKFDYNANAGEPSLKKISFKMTKKR